MRDQSYYDKNRTSLERLRNGAVLVPSSVQRPPVKVRHLPQFPSGRSKRVKLACKPERTGRFVLPTDEILESPHIPLCAACNRKVGGWYEELLEPEDRMEDDV